MAYAVQRKIRSKGKIIKIWYVRYKDTQNIWQYKSCGKNATRADADFLANKHSAEELNRHHHAPVRVIKTDPDAALIRFRDEIIPRSSKGIEKQASSIRREQASINNVLSYIKDQVVHSFKDFDKELLQRYLDFRQSMGISSKTRKEELRLLKKFSKWGLKQNFISEDPAKDVVSPKLQKKRPRYFSEKELIKIFSLAKEPYLKIFKFLYLTGVRSGELTGEVEGSVEGKLNNCPAHVLEELKQKKNEFFQHGFATYQDAAYLSYLLLKKNGYIPQIIASRFPIVIIDECQDLCYNQLMMLYYLWKAGMQIHLIGDVNQSIYEFRKVSPEKLNGFIDEIKPVRKELTTNYRSNQCIVDACCNFIGDKKGIGNEKQRDCSPLVLWQFEKSKQNDLPERFRHKLELLVDSKISYKKSAVLVRGRGLLGQISNQMKSTGEYVDDFAQAVHRWHLKQKTTNDIECSLRIMGKILCRLAYNGKGRHLDQYCPDCFDSIKWRYFISEILDLSTEVHSKIVNQAEMTINECTLIAKNFIESIWDRFPSADNSFDDIRLKIRTPKKRGDELVALHKGDSEDCLRMTTIHDVKGETLDAVLLISSPDGRGSSGGFYKDWLEPSKGNEEFTRFAYVAFSRPKHLLVVATPKLDKNYLEKFQALGFVPEEIPSSA